MAHEERGQIGGGGNRGQVRGSVPPEVRHKDCYGWGNVRVRTPSCFIGNFTNGMHYVFSIAGGVAAGLAFWGVEEFFRYLNKAYVLKISIRNFTEQTWRTTGIVGYNHTLSEDGNDSDKEIKWDDQPHSLVLPPVKPPGKLLPVVEECTKCIETRYS